MSRPHRITISPATLVLLGALATAFVSSASRADSPLLLIQPTGEAAGDVLGASVASGGDINGDGYDDVIVGAYLNDAGGPNTDNRGRVYVYFGGPAADSVADWVLTGEAAGDRFGISVHSAGDVNGDGDPDVIVGAYLSDSGGMDAGRAYVFYGGPGADSVPDLVLTGGPDRAKRGLSLLNPTLAT